MAGLGPAIHAEGFSEMFQAFVRRRGVDARVKSGHDGSEAQGFLSPRSPHLFLLYILALLLPGPAHAAGWDRVSWGMTAAEIAKLYGDRAVVLDPPIRFGDSEAPVVLRETPLAGFAFRAYFQMDPRTHRLAHVLLERRRQYADPVVWNRVVQVLREVYGLPTLACDGQGGGGRPAARDGIWRLPGETILASYLDFAGPALRYSPQDYLSPDALLEVHPFYRNLYPARRILIRYSPGEGGEFSCPRS
jgi:hypothetical protein